MESNRLKWTSYTAGAIESVSAKDMKSWRVEVREKLNSPDLGIYDPVEQESHKVGKESGKQVEYITGLKQGGHWDIFSTEMEKIWWGKIDTNKLDRIRLLIYLYEKARLEGNYLTDFCVDEKTQAIVESGKTVSYNELKSGDKIATFNKKTKKIEFQKIDRLYINNYNGEMYCMHRKNKKFYFSPNHNMLYLWHEQSKILKEDKVKNIYKQDRKINFPIWGTTEGANSRLDSEVKLISWILAEGSIHLENRWKNPYKKFGGCTICISQLANSELCLEIRKILIDLKVEFKEDIWQKIRIFRILSPSRKYIFDLLEIKSKKYKKTIPTWLYHSSITQRNLFLTEYIKGDGHSRKNEKVLYFGEKSLLKNDFIKLLLGIGIMFKETKQISGFNRTTYRLNLLQNRIISFTFDDKIKYNGKIWCPTTKNGTWVAFREGIPFVTGNCFWGDYEAVVRSDFIITYLPKDTKTVGTLLEVHICYLFGIPVYLILPDYTKTDCNSTLIDIVMKSGGEIFYSINEAVEFIKNKYKLKEPKEDKK
jgi:hypothetical protein